MKTHDFYAAGRCALASLAFCAATLMGGCTPATGDDTHFMTDAAYRRQVQADFAEKTSLVGTGFCPLDSMGLGTVETEAMQFLYAYMPVADMTDYSADFYLQNVRTAFRAISEMPWGQEVPELYFRHFVLPVRVNNERLDAFRPTYYEELKLRVSGLTMAEAILEINHWCHEHVTYQPSDGRTSSPMASMRSAYGRCGEESTFTVSALRAVGIPARQVYTPRWAHTDDNHAWVEAWADGQWHFLGACEPEPVLDLGWFNSAASRAMLMHTRVFGRYDGPEEKMLESSTFTEINLIDNYAKTARIDFHIVNADGTPAAGARIDFMIYNYAEFNPVVTKYADASGSTFLTAGMGDMMVWASLDGSYGRHIWTRSLMLPRRTPRYVPTGSLPPLPHISSRRVATGRPSCSSSARTPPPTTATCCGCWLRSATRTCATCPWTCSTTTTTTAMAPFSPRAWRTRSLCHTSTTCAATSPPVWRMSSVPIPRLWCAGVRTA